MKEITENVLVPSCLFKDADWLNCMLHIFFINIDNFYNLILSFFSSRRGAARGGTAHWQKAGIVMLCKLVKHCNYAPPNM